jgi:hypothetical protein
LKQAIGPLDGGLGHPKAALSSWYSAHFEPWSYLMSKLSKSLLRTVADSMNLGPDHRKAFYSTGAKTALQNSWTFIYSERGKARKTSVISHGSDTELENKKHYTTMHYFMGVLKFLF